MFLDYINNFRAIATLLVVFNHSIPLLDWDGNLQLERLLTIIFFNGALLFTFISGFLFQHLAYKFDYKRYLVARFKLVVSPYLVVSIPAVLIWTFVYQKVSAVIPPDFYEWSVGARILYFYATGIHLPAVWFIPMIILFYLAAPLFYWMDRHPKSYYVIPALMFLSYLVPRHWNPAIAFVHFISVYVLGMACSRYKEKLLPWVIKFVIPLSVAFVLLVIAQWKLTSEIQGYYNYWNKLIICLVLIALLDRYERRVGNIFKSLAAINFSVFFLHGYVLAAIKIVWVGKSGISLPIDGNVISHLLFASTVVLLCALLIVPARKLLVPYSRNIIGS